MVYHLVVMSGQVNETSSFVIGTVRDVGGFYIFLYFGGEGSKEFISWFRRIAVGVVEHEHDGGWGF